MNSKRSLITGSIIALLLTGCASSPTFLSPGSSVAAQESQLYMIIFYMALGVFVLVESLLVYNIIRFGFLKKNDGEEPRQIYGNWHLEVAWTAIPIILVGILFYFTVRTMVAVAAPPPGDQTLKVHIIGHQWWWEFDYPDLGIITANELHVPVSKSVALDLDSMDVIHSFWVPQLSGKVDVIPGQTNHLWFKADQVGSYHGHCAEFCGQNHANMRIKVVVESQADFDAWVKNQQQPPVQPQTEQQQKAYDLITNGICSNCHTLGDHQGIRDVGPNLTHLMSRSVFAGATYELNQDSLHQWLADNEDMKPGNRMSTVHITPEQVDELLSYLSNLK